MVFDIVINTPMYGISLAAVWMWRENEMRIVDAKVEGCGFWLKSFHLKIFFHSIFCSNFCKYTSQILFLYKYSIRLVLMRQNFMCILHFLFFLELNRLSENT